MSAPEVPYDRHYRESEAACGPPFVELVTFAEAHLKPGDTVLDLGCGQGRDALVYARLGARVHGVDVSAVGIEQLQAAATAEALSLTTEVADLVDYRPSGRFDVVILDRVLHMLPDDDTRRRVLHLAMACTGSGGHVLVADEPKHRELIRGALLAGSWQLVKDTRNRTFARKPGAGSPAG